MFPHATGNRTGNACRNLDCAQTMESLIELELLKRFLLQVIYYAYYYTVFHITTRATILKTIHIMEEHKIRYNLGLL